MSNNDGKIFKDNEIFTQKINNANITAVLGDAYKLIKEIPDKSIDLLYTDPPYLHGTGGAGGDSELALSIKKYLRDDISHINKGFDKEILETLCDSKFKNGIRAFIWCSNLQVPLLINFFQERKCSFQILVWGKTNPIPTTNGTWLSDLEYCIYASEPGAFKLNDGYDLKSKWYVSKINQNDKKKFLHPTIKPLNLVRRHLLHASNKGELVFDPFLGSGTTAIACANTDRNFLGFEIEEDYFRIIEDRVKGIDANGQLSLPGLLR